MSTPNQFGHSIVWLGDRQPLPDSLAVPFYAGYLTMAAWIRRPDLASQKGLPHIQRMHGARPEIFQAWARMTLGFRLGITLLFASREIGLDPYGEITDPQAKALSAYCHDVGKEAINEPFLQTTVEVDPGIIRLPNPLGWSDELQSIWKWRSNHLRRLPGLEGFADIHQIPQNSSPPAT